MEAVRLRLGALFEWLIAAAVIGAAVATTAVAVPEFGARHRRVPADVDVRPDTTVIPARAVSVPMLLFVDGSAVRLGDRLSDIGRRVGADAQVGPDAVERVAGHQRLTRFYEYVGTRFALVFEAADARSEPRVIAIYRE